MYFGLNFIKLKLFADWKQLFYFFLITSRSKFCFGCFEFDFNAKIGKVSRYGIKALRKTFFSEIFVFASFGNWLFSNFGNISEMSVLSETFGNREKLAKFSWKFRKKFGNFRPKMAKLNPILTKNSFHSNTKFPNFFLVGTSFSSFFRTFLFSRVSEIAVFWNYQK
jgi:hypothetical protein